MRLFAISPATVVVMLAFTTLVRADTTRPNVVMIISDDQTYTDFGFMGNRRVQTPNLDALARRSAMFTAGYVPSSVCRPSLVTMLTGLYPHQHGVYFNHPPPGFSRLTRDAKIDKETFDSLRSVAADQIRDLPTLPRVLAARGYRCLQTGKFWEGHYRNAGFTEGMTTAQPSGGKNGDKVIASGDVVAHGNGDHGLAIGRETMEPIDDLLFSDSSDPFFIWYAPFLPHVPHDSPEKYKAIYRSRTDVAEYERPYFAAITQFDETVGHLLESLRRSGNAHNTLIVFVVDNGWQPDANRFVPRRSEWDHTKNSKRAPFDAGLRTPILFAWPSRITASKHDAPVSTVDLVPTILTAIQCENQVDWPGVDLWPVVSGQQPADADRAVYGAIYPGDATELGNPSGDVAYRWIRQGEYKLIVPHRQRNRSPWNGYLAKPALFNVVDDPEEKTNLMELKGRRGRAAQLKSRLDDWWMPDS